jgi:hypothetical protein
MKPSKITAMIILATCTTFSNVAVSEITGTASVAPGKVDSDDSINTEGSVTIPVKKGFKFQFDGLYADVDKDDYSGAVGRFFWQNKDTAYLGIDIGGVLSDHVDSYEGSIEGEYYFNKITIGGKTGIASIKYDQDVTFIDTDEQKIFGSLYINFFPLADFLLSSKVENRFDNNSFSVSAEYLLPILDGLSVFGTGMTAEHGYNHWFVGLRYYFGGGESLKEKHRSKAPQQTISDILFGITTYNAEYDKKDKGTPVIAPSLDL